MAMGIEASADLPPGTNLDIEYARLNDLAVSHEATAHQLAVEGMSAYWHAFRQPYPAMTVPARAMMQRVDYEGVNAVGDIQVYSDAKATAAFGDVYSDWAGDEAASEVSITNAFEDLQLVIQELKTTARSTVTAALLRRLTYMAFVARAGDNSLIIFPAPPAIQRSADSGSDAEGKKYDALIFLDEQFVGGHFPSQWPKKGGSKDFLSVISSHVYWHNLQIVDHPFVQEVDTLPRPRQIERIIYFAADLLTRDASQLTTHDIDFMEATTADALDRTRGMAYRFGLAVPPEPNATS